MDCRTFMSAAECILLYLNRPEGLTRTIVIVRDLEPRVADTVV